MLTAANKRITEFVVLASLGRILRNVKLVILVFFVFTSLVGAFGKCCYDGPSVKKQSCTKSCCQILSLLRPVALLSSRSFSCY